MPVRLRNGVLLMLAVLASILLLAACGSSSSKPKHARIAANVFIAYSKCMRANGVTNFPDPTGHGIQLSASSGINPRSPAFQKAQSTCSKLLPGGGPQSHRASEQEIRTATATAECMRRHGVPNFPDPIVSQKPPSSLNPADYSEVTAGGGIIIAIPKSIDPQSPAFEKAAKACQFER
jgi:hypothetical protein